MDERFDIQEYLTRGVESIVAESLKATLKNPRESAFMIKFASASKKASGRQAEAEKAGEHIPPFLIASITSRCNLHCAGCYSRCNHATVDGAPVYQLTAEEWLKVFREADELGVSYILLAGGEPMLRRGQDVYDRLISNMQTLHDRTLLFGVSVTVTTRNVREVLSHAFLDTLAERGCKLVIYVEFVPVTRESTDLAPGETERTALRDGIARLRGEYRKWSSSPFPGTKRAPAGALLPDGMIKNDCQKEELQNT